MSRVVIDDLDDPRIAIYRNLKATNQTRGSELFVLEGVKLLDALRASRYPIDSALVTDCKEELIASRVPTGVPLYVVPQDCIDALVGYNFHQGVLASARRQPPIALDTIVENSGPACTLVVCPRLDNPENLGALVRIGDVFGVAGIMVGGRCPDPLSRRVLRVSMGAALRLPVVVSGQLEEDWEYLRRRWGVMFAAAVTDPGAEPFESLIRPARLALVLGSESAGLDAAWVARSDRRITIPMRSGADSLNLAVATGILLHHLSNRADRE